jgi:CelD/BcsL family acetyltransferase involved in cellulose biosynthesis
MAFMNAACGLSGPTHPSQHTSEAVRVVRFNAMPQDLDIRRQWDEMVQAMECPEIFYTWEWSEALWRAYGASLQLMLLAAFRGQTLVGVVALKIEKSNCATFLNSITADYCDFISRPNDRSGFVHLVFEELRRAEIRAIRLANLPADSCSIPALRSAGRASGYKIFSSTAYFCPQILLHSEEARAKAGGLARRRSRDSRKKLSALGRVAVVHSSDAQSFRAQLPQFFAAHVTRFLSDYRLSNLIATDRRKFLEELVGLLSQRGWLTASILQLDGKSVAWNLGTTFAGKWFWYQPAFDIAWQRAAPGNYLLCDLIRSASQNSGIYCVDLGLGDESYKHRFTKAGRGTLNISATRSAVRLASNISRYYMASLIKKSPRVERGLRTALSRIATKTRQGTKQRSTQIFEWAKKSVFSRTETVFFESVTASEPRSCKRSPLALGLALAPLSLEILASAALEYESDKHTLAYLLRCAKRLSSGQAEGFVLTTPNSAPVHFCWMKPFANCWISGVGHKLSEPAANSVLLFDCWTPAAVRRSGYFQHCISMVATDLLKAGTRPWIFTDSQNSSAMHGIVAAGFERRFSYVRRKVLLFSRTSQLEFSQAQIPILDGFAPAA